MQHPEQASHAGGAGRNGANAPDSDAFTIMIAEDNDVNIKILQHFLEHYDCDIIIAKDGRKAVDTFRKRKIDLVLMDVNMPLMDGFDATRGIRKIERESGRTPTPVIAVTAHIKPADQHLCIAAGMNDYFSKPVRLEQMRRALRIWTPGLRAKHGTPPTTH